MPREDRRPGGPAAPPRWFGRRRPLTAPGSVEGGAEFIVEQKKRAAASRSARSEQFAGGARPLGGGGGWTKADTNTRARVAIEELDRRAAYIEG